MYTYICIYICIHIYTHIYKIWICVHIGFWHHPPRPRAAPPTWARRLQRRSWRWLQSWGSLARSGVRWASFRPRVSYNCMAIYLSLSLCVCIYISLIQAKGEVYPFRYLYPSLSPILCICINMSICLFIYVYK